MGPKRADNAGRGHKLSQVGIGISNITAGGTAGEQGL
jgi:hypothetical protein